MNYNIFDRVAPAMPSPTKGTEFVKLLLSQASKDMHEPLVPMLFPSLGAHISFVENQCHDHKWRVICSQEANLVVKSGGRDTPNCVIRHASLPDEGSHVGR